jgi:hypothetical protein
MFVPSIVFVALLFLAYSIGLAVVFHKLGRKDERFEWYKFMRDHLRPDNAATIQTIARGVMTAMQHGYLPEFLAELAKSKDKDNLPPHG